LILPASRRKDDASKHESTFTEMKKA